METRIELRAESDDIEEDMFRAAIYRELEWIRHDKKRKPGWTGVTFKKLFGVWPADWLKDLTPAPPRKELTRMINRFDARFRRAKQRERQGVVAGIQGGAEQAKHDAGPAERHAGSKGAVAVEPRSR